MTLRWPHPRFPSSASQIDGGSPFFGFDVGRPWKTDLGAIWRPSWGHLGPILGASGANLGAFGANLGPSWANLGNLGAILGHLGAILVPSWAFLGPPGAILGHLGAVLGPSWSHLGAILVSRNPKQAWGRTGSWLLAAGFWLLAAGCCLQLANNSSGSMSRRQGVSLLPIAGWLAAGAGWLGAGCWVLAACWLRADDVYVLHNLPVSIRTWIWLQQTLLRFVPRTAHMAQDKDVTPGDHKTGRNTPHSVACTELPILHKPRCY